ncbi:hypothetical protein BD410DRAFT_900882 [Rickenella mellea]|uniref:Uncharacterized protein n=1 Tax=Rickenella mellea TaxID=50990 RepID=A0A4Y7PV91_9AGAM|nr:hypothetical protein BD410DRAFT_900882 [Rickenella mellea]
MEVLLEMLQQQQTSLIPTQPHLHPEGGIAGIYCANLECKMRSGERSRGHQSCRALLCGNCCQNAARLVAETGENRPVCKVHSKRVHTGHRPSRSGSEVHAQTGDNLELEDINGQVDQIAQMEAALKKSIMLVIWYRNGIEPLRLPYEVPTFPLFRLSDFPDLMGDLGLSPSSYIDAYNAETGQWEQHKITTVRSIAQRTYTNNSNSVTLFPLLPLDLQETVPRLLYRLRPSLLESLTDCPSLDTELGLQPPSRHEQEKKRQLEEASAPPAKYHRIAGPSTASPVSNGSSYLITSNGKVNQALLINPAVENGGNLGSTSSSSPEGNSNTNPIVPIWHSSAPIEFPTCAQDSGINHLSSTAHTQPKPSTPSTTTKRWPTDFSVREVVAGFTAMSTLIANAPTAGSIRQKAAFESVFGCKYVKSTTGRAKLYWKRASEEVRAHFLSIPQGDAAGRWANLVHLMDGKLVIEVGGEEGDVAGRVDGPEGGNDEEEGMHEENDITGASGVVPIEPIQMQNVT